MNLIGISLTVLFSLAVLFGSRTVAALGVFGAVCYITQGQVVDVGGFHFHAIRIVLLAGVIRILVRGELQQMKLTAIDRALIAFVLYSVVVAGVRRAIWQEQVGSAYNILFSYFVLRCLIITWEDCQALLGALTVFIIPLALSMTLESLTGKNVFGVMGGQDGLFSREGRYRCIGSFRGAHTAGTFGATMMPLLVSLLFVAGRQRVTPVAGIIAATAITYTSNASGPLMAYVSALVGLLFWRFRKVMRKIRWGLLLSLISLAIIMKAPIWYLIAKISTLTGGDGWHRSYLMEQCANHFSDWWLMGTNDTADWAATIMSTGTADITNYYVSCAANAGLGSLLLFILLLVRSFSGLGHALSVGREFLPESEKLLWCLGAALFAHVVTLFSVTYWDQFHVVWWGLLAIIASVSADVLNRGPSAESVEETPESSPDAERMAPSA